MTDMQITEAQIKTWATAVVAEIDNDAANGVFDDFSPASWDALAQWIDSFDYFTAVGVPWGSDLAAGEDDGHAVTDAVAKAVDAVLKARAEAAEAARPAELDALYEATQAHESFMGDYAQAEADNDRNPTAEGYEAWLERQLWNARYGLD